MRVGGRVGCGVTVWRGVGSWGGSRERGEEEGGGWVGCGVTV